MPTPYGSRGGMAFSADELRVLRGALAAALQSSPSCAARDREMLWLAEALDEAEREGYRLRSFLRADLARYRAALPGSAVGYLAQLEDALASGYPPLPEDLTALRKLADEPAGREEAARRASLLERCRCLVEQVVGARVPVLPASRWRVPEYAEEKPRKEPRKEPRRDPSREPRREPQKPGPSPSRRPVPTPGEVFPPRRRPKSPPQEALPA